MLDLKSYVTVLNIISTSKFCSVHFREKRTKILMTHPLLNRFPTNQMVSTMRMALHEVLQMYLSHFITKSKNYKVNICLKIVEKYDDKLKDHCHIDSYIF